MFCPRAEHPKNRFSAARSKLEEGIHLHSYSHMAEVHATFGFSRLDAVTIGIDNALRPERATVPLNIQGVVDVLDDALQS